MCRTDIPRPAAVLNYFADGTISDTDESMFIDKDIYIPKVNSYDLVDLRTSRFFIYGRNESIVELNCDI